MPVSGRAQMTSAPESPGMIKIGRPVVRALPLLIAVCVPACPLLAVPTAEAFGDAAWRYPLALVCWLALLPGAIILCLVLWYRPVAFDPGTRMARLGWREVPLSTVTTARREVSTGTSATYLSYRFASTDGAWGRVLVAGRPMRGLSPEGLRRLERFVEAAGIHDPADEDALTPTQRYLADQLSVSRMLSTKSTVGKAALLAELRGEPLPEPFHPPGQGPPPAPGQAQPPTLERWQPPTPEQWQRDDRDAEAYLLDQPVVGRNARRFFQLLIAVATLAFLTAIIVAAVLEQRSTSGRLDSDTNSVVGLTVVGSIGLGLAAYIGYCVACYFSIRHAQQVSLDWLRGRDAGQVERGLPLPLLAPFLGPPPGHRLKMLTALATGIFGGFGLLAAPIIYFAASGDNARSDVPPPGVAVIPLVLGAGATALAVALYVNARRVYRRQHSFAARLGRRLHEGPEDVVDPGDDPADYPAGPDPGSGPAAPPASTAPAP